MENETARARDPKRANGRKTQGERDTEFSNGRISTVFNNVRGARVGRGSESAFAAMVQRNDVRIRPQSPNNLMIARSLPWNARSRADRMAERMVVGVTKSIA